MKTMVNMTTSSEDLDRFAGREELLEFLQDFDGVELMQFEEDFRGMLPRERVIGLHMGYFPCWLDFWKGNEAALLKEFGSRDVWEQIYGGADRTAILKRFRKDLQWAHHYGAEYVVFHVSEATIEESFTWKYQHTDEEVIDAVIELLNELFEEEDGSLALLVENLWQPGLTFTRPDMTKRLLEGIRYPNKGIMLDTGHLLHTNMALRTQEEGLAYIHTLLDAHGSLCSYIRGIHLNQSLTGEYCEQTRNNPPKLGDTYQERYGKMFWHAFAVDQHLPFTCEGVEELIKRIGPEYLTFEFITGDKEQHREYLKRQREALPGIGTAVGLKLTKEQMEVEGCKRAREVHLDRITGCLVGGAVGDALGYPVEFFPASRILYQYGGKGITQYALDSEGIARISDDTQMTLFTANGILMGETRGKLRGIGAAVENYVHLAYMDWLATQRGKKAPLQRFSWLLDVPELYALRAPGSTCLGALSSNRRGSVEEPINDSKGCGGIMRVAPVALWKPGAWRSQDAVDQLAMTGAQVAAITHGHSLGYMPAAVLVYILNRLVFEPGAELRAVVDDSKEMLKRKFAGDKHLHTLLELMDLAVELAGNDNTDADNIYRLGEGWVAEETLAIALYCSLRYEHDFSAGVIASVNHNGDSDSTGAVTGNILGAIAGAKGIESKWTADLELYDVLLEISWDLCHGCQMSEYGSYRDEAWLQKYVEHKRWK